MTLEEQKKFLEASGLKSRKAQLLSSMSMKEYYKLAEIKVKNGEPEMKWVESFVKQMEKEASQDFEKNKDTLVAAKMSELGA